MTQMIFETFAFPQNPDKLQHCYSREPVYTRNEDGEQIFSGMGTGRCVITGSGAFTGDNAYGSFRKLLELFEAGTCGTLYDPTWGVYRGYLTGLELTQEPRNNYVAYRFEFTRADSGETIPQI